MRRIGNAFVKAVLRSPFHRLLSRSVMLLTFRGRRTGRWYTTPVMYATAPDGSLVVASARADRKQWWRNVRGGVPVQVRLGPRRMDGRGEVLDEGARADAERLYLDRFPRARRAFGADRPVMISIRAFRSPPDAL